MAKALLLDRDGVINRDFGHVHELEQFEFLPGIFELCRVAQSLDYLTIVVTNQAGIARGYYSEWDFARLTNWMMGRFVLERCPIASVYYCPFHAELGKAPYAKHSEDRKPGPGMFRRAAADFALKLDSCIALGDKLSDMLAAQAAGVRTRILLAPSDSTERGAETHLVASLDEASEILRLAS